MQLYRTLQVKIKLVTVLFYQVTVLFYYRTFQCHLVCGNRTEELAAIAY